MKNISVLNFPIKGDERGSLIALEQGVDVPFDIKRIYYIFGTKLGVSRGYHAHYNLEQMVICLKGSVTFRLDNGVKQETKTLSSPDEGLHMKGLIWREMHNFSEDCVLMVIASELYDEADYIRDYEMFKQEANRANSSSQ
ncbi:dTDP-6-deoxy-3,4-keto-hexulose isomerase [Vibrio navarrensis]|uniref:WxcM-like domain-containing protein n=1 Tax=Vibrio navarrensis TaxID=29495 RepID=A0AAJ4IBH1_9VIBR|nr:MULTISPECIES: FdtA/QdtA family cupin domain-containing protein [Vibrio]KJR36121.1 dTDP-6-deoxy-3,4-keto-hexulose isomerase [Vibrio sp. S234-5]MBE3661048.1 dTDP-6-deoxy-3,4-keto-hexulose isomerase [Vibrio navarrensis]MBE4603462.1 dTDP-6-deoxy-3,4-keto-hexulose isomerase [Vibrio navarrensis]QPL53789.1 WxcM-like domain-containing protein [Vibrio navarrensis]